MKTPHVSALVCWVYDEPHASLIGQVTAAVVVRVIDAERGKVDLHAFRLNCHATILVKAAEYSDDGEPGTWHWPGE